MKIVLISNYLNHHQLPLCLAFREILGSDFVFIANSKTPKFRIKLGYTELNEQYDFVLCAYESYQKVQAAMHLCDEADVVIIGSAPDMYVKRRIKQKKLTFYYSERIFKQKMRLIEWPARIIKYFWEYGRHRNVYLLCASAYSAADYAKTFTFIGKAYKWGYFTELKRYSDIDKVIADKTPKSLLWVARMIPLKHPEAALTTLKRLIDDGYDVTLNFIGDGDMIPQIINYVSQNHLENNVNLLGTMPPEKVREKMVESEILLFTSDRQEGWGAVLNEAMNSACAVVSSHAAGAAPFLIKHGENGMIYREGDIDGLYKNVKYLLDNQQKRKNIEMNAYNTIAEQWNGQNAAERFIRLSDAILKGEKSTDLFDDGVCSKAEILKDDWIKGI